MVKKTKKQVVFATNAKNTEALAAGQEIPDDINIIEFKPDPKLQAPEHLKKHGLTKRQLRYWCFRFRSSETSAVDALGAPEGVREYYESLDWFPGWKTFGVTWDLHKDNPFLIVPLKEDPTAKWNADAFLSSKELPKKSETN